MYGSHHVCTDSIGGCRRPGDAEIRHLYFSVFRNNNILRLDITMDDMMLMCRFHTGHHLDRNADGLLRRYPTLLFYIIFQGNTVYQLHDHKIQSPVLTDIVYIDYIGMHQSRCRSCLADKLAHKYPVRAIITF